MPSIDYFSYQKRNIALGSKDTIPMSTQEHDTPRDQHSRPAPDGSAGPVFYTVAEVALLLRVDRATVYRAIRDDAFPAVRVRSRYVVPAVAVEQLAARAAEYGGCVDVAAIAAERRIAREVLRQTGGRR